MNDKNARRDIINYINGDYNNTNIKFNIGLDSNGKSFLLGANINVCLKSESYICIYLGFRTLVIGWFEKY